jgi:serine/threonine protein kinase
VNQLSSIPSSFGNYQVLRQLGSGGFANVYLGKHRYLGTHAAIKVLKEQLSQQALQSFVEEARTVATLKHPHIVRVLEFGVEEQTAFLAMDYAPSGTLRKLHPEGSRLPLRVIIPYVKQVAAALQHAHDRNIVHRDIKPENMLVDTDKTVLLSDFGIALLVEHRTRSMARHEAIGTAAYMAPEQIKEKPRPASDQYSLAVVVYEWLCGTYPFDGPNDIAIALQHINTPPPPLRSHVPGIPPAVEQVVL